MKTFLQLAILAGLAALVCPVTTATAMGELSRQVPILSYGQTTGAVDVDFRGTALAPDARGDGQWEAGRTHIGIKAHFEGLPPATRFGPQYSTYVLWAVTADGRAANLSEVKVEGPLGKVDAKAGFRAFGLIMTAEPYFAVSQPSELVVLEAEPAAGGTTRTAPCELVPKRHYPPLPDPAATALAGIDPESALALHEARYALFFAGHAGADRYAPRTFSTAEQLLKQGEAGAASQIDKKTLDETARAATLIAEDARVLALRRRANQREQAREGDELP